MHYAASTMKVAAMAAAQRLADAAGLLDLDEPIEVRAELTSGAPGTGTYKVSEDYLAVRELVSSTPGCRSVRMTRGVESPSRFVLLVESDTIEAHEKNFRESERFTAWRDQISRYFASPPTVEHFLDVD